jgi:YgiT-type zinc finger domain-containing protein
LRDPGNPFISLCGNLEEEELLIVTAYEPDTEEWEKDGKTRKRGSERWLRSVVFAKRVSKEDVIIDYRWGGTLIVIKGVPAGACQQCGEKYIDSSIYKGMEELAKTKNHLLGKMSVDVLEFEGVSAA